MKQILLVLTFFFCTILLMAQDNSRIEVKGKIILDVENLENITIYNTSSNSGTITDSIGNFKIKVALNDVIRISSVQLKPFNANITNAVIDTKVLKIYLKEHINTLDEVVLLSYDLTGDLTTDVLDAKVSKSVIFDFESFNNFEIPDDYHSKVDNIAIGNQNERQRFQLDGFAIVSALAKLIFKTKKKNKKERINPKLKAPISNASQALKPKYFTENYNIPEDKVQSFIGFLEQSKFDVSLLEAKNELKLIAYLHAKSKIFLSKQNEEKE